MISGSKITVKIFRATIAITAWVALALQLYILLNNTPGNGMTPLQAVGRFLIFFTILTNLVVAASMTILFISPASKQGIFLAKPSSQAAIAVYILIVGLVYNLILRSLWTPEGWQKLADELLHVAVPLLFVLYWFLFAPKYSLQWKHCLPWLIYPAAYLVYALTRGAIEGFYPYPFIDVDKLGYGKVMMHAGGMLILFILTGLLFILMAGRLSKKTI